MRTYAMTTPFMHGADLKPLQERLKAIGLYAGKVDGIFGVSSGVACRQAKWRLGYPVDAVKRTGGQTLLNYLTGATELPPDYIKRRHERGFGVDNKEDTIRKALAEHGRWGIRNEPQIHYRQSRPIDGLHHPRKLPLYTDCSGFVTCCYSWADGPDPNGRRFDGYGYTGDEINHGRTVPLAFAKPGDLVIWGAFPGHHVAMVLEPGADPLLVSHGQERGPLEVRLSVETRVQRRQWVIKSYL